MKKLIDKLNQANKEYYQNNREIMSNKEYDELYDQLVALEKETGIIYSNSPTQKVGYEIKSKLQKVKHSAPVLSLDKTKDIEKLKSWLGDQIGVLSWKLDGLTVILDYENGQLVRAVTRGNGSEGEDITHNAKVFKNLPLTIPYKEKLQIRGEALIGYEDFEMINVDNEYKNPRNLASGSVRQLDSNIAAQRQLRFVAFECVTDITNSYGLRLPWLERQGFEVVDYYGVDKDNLEFIVEKYKAKIKNNPYPTDGLVLVLNDVVYGKSLGGTSKFNHNALAFKWMDSVVESTLLGIEWQVSRTGLINPVAVFNPVEIDGSTVNKASVHNLSIIEELELGLFDAVTIYKANAIIPQIDENLTRSNNIPIPTQCPVCGGKTEIRQIKESKTLHCINSNCPAQLVKSISHYVSRDAMNIDGFSEATIEKFVKKGYLKEISDIYELYLYENEIKNMDGFGEKSCQKLINSIKNSQKDVNLTNFLYALGIDQVGKNTAKVLCKYFDNDFNAIMAADEYRLIQIDDIGDITACGIYDYFVLHKKNIINKLLPNLTLKKEENRMVDIKENIFNGKTVYATGTFQNYKKEEIKNLLESFGAKFASGYAKSLDYLIEGSLKSSTKVDKARKDGIPVLSEKEFMEMIS